MCFHFFYKQRNLNSFMREKHEEFHFWGHGCKYIADTTNYFLVPTNYVSSFIWENGGEDLNVLSLYICK